MSNPVVFISYSHDSDEHRERVLALSERLRQDGIDTRLDRYPNGTPPEGWPRWMLNQLDEAKFVLVICTETYYRRFRGHEQPGKGKGADWEGALITQEIYDSRSNTTKFVPVFLKAVVDAHIPEPLRKDSYYVLASEDAYRNLYDFLLGQAGIEPGPLGELKSRPRRQGTALSFDAAPQAARIDISRIDKYAPAELIGREAETGILNDAWHQTVSNAPKRPHVLTFVALGGEGKTSLVAKWAAELAHENWPGCEAVFAWSFYSQGTKEQTAASSDLFLDAALEFFGDKEMAQSSQHASEKGKRLAQLVGAKRALLILDGLEPLQYAPTSVMPGELKDQGIAALLKGLAASSHGLCVVTTRYAIPDLNAYKQSTAPEIKLLRLSREAGVNLLQSLGVKGGFVKNIPVGGGSELLNEFEKLVEDVRGHALTLNLLGAYLRDAHHGDIRRRDRIKLEEADAEEQGGHAFRVMDAYVQSFESEGAKGRRALALLRLLGLFDRPAPADCLQALWQGEAIAGLTDALGGVGEAQRNIALTRLESAGLLTQNHETGGALLSLDAHPLLREYFAKQLREHYPEAWRAAHQRLYQYLCATTKEGDKPTLAELQPLYQAVVHGCLAGMEQQACDEVYHARILRGKEAYSANKLGAFGPDLGAVACFFEIPWSRVSPKLAQGDQAWLLNEAASGLRALGRLGEAVEPMRVTMEINANKSQWKNAAVCASNLSELELTLGMLDAAVSDAAQSVNYADQSGDSFQRMGKRTTHADALHQAGLRPGAEARFREAEVMQAEDQPAYPLLYSLPGFRYCDLLLAAAERAAWRAMLPSPAPKGRESLNGAGGKGSSDEASRDESIRLTAVSARAAQTIKIAERNNWLLDIALDHLTLGRAALYAALLKGASPSCHESIEQAVDGLRRAGQSDYLPRGLLTRAWLRVLESNSEAAKADLDEALEIAERGTMPLFMADIYLHRARLFFREAEYPWHNEDGTPRSAQQDLAKAWRLIEKHGYWRRKEELEDAEAVIGR
ncbi:MAG TPA: SEFIR domain-containing protein [Gallionella sp.]|nr:SEFIR domain-containing protein [Gallionella sp.]